MRETSGRKEPTQRPCECARSIHHHCEISYADHRMASLSYLQAQASDRRRNGVQHTKYIATSWLHAQRAGLSFHKPVSEERWVPAAAAMFCNAVANWSGEKSDTEVFLYLSFPRNLKPELAVRHTVPTSFSHLRERVVILRIPVVLYGYVWCASPNIIPCTLRIQMHLATQTKATLSLLLMLRVCRSIPASCIHLQIA